MLPFSLCTSFFSTPSPQTITTHSSSSSLTTDHHHSPQLIIAHHSPSLTTAEHLLHNLLSMTSWNNSTIKYKNSKHFHFISTIFYNIGIELSWQLTIVHNLSKLDLIYFDTLVPNIKNKLLFYCFNAVCVLLLSEELHTCIHDCIIILHSIKPQFLP